ncbi:hypothetical protein BSL78_02435 [Apostichopus japonicus]|uniref:Ig-like domain-containing protein n=1 Tax=Stichopus japonicus TaxID=307972 RepID=A0A2G8LKG7_STIJA|nr:hypothetical protein BSL78_02435 [Apostichopus japonicus]
MRTYSNIFPFAYLRTKTIFARWVLHVCSYFFQRSYCQLDTTLSNSVVRKKLFNLEQQVFSTVHFQRNISVFTGMILRIFQTTIRVYPEGQKRGNGYESREYDLYTNGSLLINRVTIEHDRIFTVVLFETRISNLVPNKVDVKVFARPLIPFPVIDKCVNKQHCYQQIERNDTMECTVTDVRPPVHLSWVKRTSDGDLDEHFQLTYFPKDGLNTTTATLKFHKRASLHFYLFVCKAESAISILDYSDSFLLVEVYITPIREQENILLQEARNGSVITLPCDVQDDTIFIVWKKKIKGTRYDVIAYYYNNTVMVSPESPYILNHDGALVIPQIDLIPQINQSQENVYVCYVSNGIEEHVKSYNVTIENAQLVLNRVLHSTALYRFSTDFGSKQHKSYFNLNFFLFKCFKGGGIELKAKTKQKWVPPLKIKHSEVTNKSFKTNQEGVLLLKHELSFLFDFRNLYLPGKELLDDRNPQTQTESDNLNHEDENRSKKQHENPEQGEIQDHQNNIQIKKYVVGSEKPDREEKIIFLIHGSNIEIDAIAFILLKYVTGVKNKDHFSCDVKCLDSNQTLQSCGIEIQICTLKDNLSSELPFDITFVIIPVSMRGSVGSRSTAFAPDTTSIGDMKDSNDTPVTVATTGSSDATMQGKMTFATDAASEIDFKEITEQLHTLTTCEDTYKLEYVNAVIILQDITQELSPTLEDCLHHPVFKILGKNLRDKVIAMIACNTKGEFDDFKTKGSIEYPYHVYFSLKSNSKEVVFYGTQSERNFKNFKEKLKNESPVSLEHSMEVLSKRKDLVVAISKIEESMAAKTKISNETTENYKKHLINTSGIKVSIESKELALNCIKCKNTCIYPVVSKTWSFFSFSCNVCKCDTRYHHECSYRFKTEDDIKKEMCDKELSLHRQVRTKAEEIDSYLNFLNEFALKPTFCSVDRNAQT